MICDKYEALTPKEKSEMVGSVVHAFQSDSALFDMALEIIRLGELKGLFDRVKIMPENDIEESLS